MTDEDARSWISDHFGNSAVDRLESFVRILLDESKRQNLIARSTIATIWSRHIADSAQLALLGPANGRWVDIGSGGGLPGLVVAIVRPFPMVLIEPRRKRAEFLVDACDQLGLKSVVVEPFRAESYHRDDVAVISARAVSSLDVLFRAATGFSDLSTTFVLPKGRSASLELAEVRRSWHGMFHVEPSVTDTSAGIIIATGVQRR